MTLIDIRHEWIYPLKGSILIVNLGILGGFHEIAVKDCSLNPLKPVAFKKGLANVVISL